MGRQGRRVTLDDVAAESGMSRATVSLVLRGSPLVSDQTRALVQEAIRRCGYVYNRSAANLRAQTSSCVALVINDLANPFFAEFAAGVDETLAERGFVTLLGCTGESVARQRAVLSSMIEHAPAGIILSPAEGSLGKDVGDAVGGVPLLVFNREIDGTWPCLGMDNQLGARLATEHLIALGHRRIAFFGGHRESSSCSQRLAGYLEAMHAAGLEPRPAWRVETAPTRLEAARSAAALFARDPAPTAAVCYNDAVALGLQWGLMTRGIRPGVDFAVVGFDGIPEGEVSVPPLTTIWADPRACGRMAAERILATLGTGDASPDRTISPVRLVVRESCCPPPAKGH